MDTSTFLMFHLYPNNFSIQKNMQEILSKMKFLH